MNIKTEKQHLDTVIGQFSRQAIPFTQVPGHLDSIQTLIEMSKAGPLDTVLDVASGPGLVACEFARTVKQVTGIDITPAMLEEAQKRQRQEQLMNLDWVLGTATPLPFPDNFYSLVISRYSFHHLLDPRSVMQEMIRVCQPGGRVLVADIAIATDKSVAFDHLEVMRDPSHTHALTHDEFFALFHNSPLTHCRQCMYSVDIELEAQLKASFPKPGDEEKIRQNITHDIGVDRLDINARNVHNKVMYTVPIDVFVGHKPS